MIMFEVLIIGIPAFFLSFQPNDSRVSGNFISYVIKKSLPSALLMVLSVFVVEIFRMTTPNANKEIFDTMGIYVLTFAGLINLYITCKPLNKYRSFVFISNALLVVIISAIAFTGVLENIISLVSLLPFKDNLANILIILLITLANIPLSLGLQKLFEKLDLTNIINKKKA